MFPQTLAKTLRRSGTLRFNPARYISEAINLVLCIIAFALVDHAEDPKDRSTL